MSPSRPYIVRALYEWIVDNDCTPYLVVDATLRHVDVPQEYVKDGQIILNISPSAVMGLTLENHLVRFNGRFSGHHTPVSVPMGAVVGIYARENGQGMVFEPEEFDDPEPPRPTSTRAGGRKGSVRPSLTVVK